MGHAFAGCRASSGYRLGTVQRLDLRFSSTHSTSAFSGGFMYSPTTSRTLSTNCGSVDSLNVSWRCGLSPNARQIREIADWLIPVAAAIDRVDQCVASTGLDSRVLHDHLLDCLIGHRARRTGTRLVGQPLKPVLHKPGPPLADGDLVDPQQLGDRGVGVTLGAGQHDPRPQRQLLRRLRPTSPPLQRLPLLIGELKYSFRATRRRHKLVYQLSRVFLTQHTRRSLMNRWIRVVSRLYATILGRRVRIRVVA